MTSELEQLEAELATRTKPSRPAADLAEKKRIEQDERNLRAKLCRDLDRQKMLDAMTVRQAEERRSREWAADGGVWDAADIATNSKRGY
ncbi:hypothetical protein [Paraburkholderia sediminicola]|uniref:hypothetical protein n=1 Tax=Paraburkholderia sediminicola TaxID=458836 RepID=UPI0038BC5BCA